MLPTALVTSLSVSPRRKIELAELYADGLADPDEWEAAAIAGGDWSLPHPAGTACYAAGCAAARHAPIAAESSAEYAASAISGRIGTHDDLKGSTAKSAEHAVQAAILRDIFGNPFRPVAFDPTWRTDTAASLARQMYDAREFSAMPILADALQDAGCDSDDILNHCRGEGPHVRGCWVCDLVLGKS
jgi:hypothetical protein